MIEVTPRKFAELFNIETRKQDAIRLKENIDWQINSKGSSLIINGKTLTANTRSEEALRKSLIKALEWNQRLLNGSVNSISQITKEEGLNSSYVRRTLRLAFLNPELIKTIINNKKTCSITLENYRTENKFDWHYI